MKRFLWGVVFLGVLFWSTFLSPSMAAEKGPIKVGFLSPLTGQWAEVGKDMTNGFMMYMEEIGFKAGGRTIQVIREDTQALPDTAVTKTRKLITHDKVAAVTGLVTAPSGLAVAPIANELEVPLIIACSAGDDNTQRKRVKWATRIGWTSSQPMHPFGEWVYKKLGYKKVAAIAVDFAFGYENVGGFQRTFEEAGGQVIQKLWAPVNTNDFAPYISNLSKEADAVLAVMVGAMPMKFVKQYSESGLKLPVICSGTTVDEYILPAQGDEVIGYISPLHYSAALDNPANKRFQEKYTKKYNKIGSYYASHCYEMGMWLVRAIEAVKGDVEQKEAFLKAIKAVKLADIPRGPLSMDEYGNPIQNIYIRKVEKIKGVKWNTVIDTIPNVSQFWKWNPEEYLKAPPYSRDYPPCKYCK